MALKPCGPCETLPEVVVGEAGRSNRALDILVVDAMRELIGEDGQEALGQLIEEHLAHTADRLAEAKAALEQGDAGTARRLLHMIKGSSATFGAVALARLCAEIGAASGETAQSDADCTRLEEAGAAVNSEMKALSLSSMGPQGDAPRMA